MSVQMSIVSSNGIFAHSDWMSKDAIKRSGSWSRIPLQNEKESLTVYYSSRIAQEYVEGIWKPPNILKLHKDKSVLSNKSVDKKNMWIMDALRLS